MGHKLETELKGGHVPLVPQCFLRLCSTYIYRDYMFASIHSPSHSSTIPYVAKFSRPKNFANRFQKGGQKYSRQKYSRRRL